MSTTRAILARVRRYSEELPSAEPEHIGALSDLSKELLETTHFSFQLKTANTILGGKDTVLDAPTGSGKSL